MDPALRGHVTGDGEQTIGQIQTRGEHGRFVFFLWAWCRRQVDWFAIRSFGFDSHSVHDDQHGGFVLKWWITCQWWPMGLF